jgi:hypothetical protein
VLNLTANRALNGLRKEAHNNTLHLIPKWSGQVIFSLGQKNMNPKEILEKGRKYIDSIMESNGFQWESGLSGRGSGGQFDRGQYIKDDRKLDLHFRYSLGLVKYHIGNISLSHEDYMSYVAGKGNSKYPGFSSDPYDGFRHLADDLKNYAKDFLSGTGEEFIKAKEKAIEREKLSGFKKLSSN